MEKWRSHTLGELAKPLALNNFHLTLRYIGNCTPAEIGKLQTAADQIRGNGMTLNVDRLGHFKQPKVLYLGISHCPEALQVLARKINFLVDELLLKEHCPDTTKATQYKFTPHITIARKVSQPVAPPPPFSLPISVKRFALFESISTPAGVVYTELKCWQLC